MQEMSGPNKPSPHPLNWNEWTSDVQFHLTPAADGKAVGGEGAVGHSFLHVSPGAPWTEHRDLTDLAIGDAIPPGRN